jgi:hypothetical protein
MRRNLLVLLLFSVLGVSDGFFARPAARKLPNSRVALAVAVDGKALVMEAAQRLVQRFWEIDLKTKARMDKIISLYERERIDASAFHGVNGYG